MKDLTRDSLCKHIILIAAQVFIVLSAQFAYQPINLYFVSRLGPASVAGVTAAANLAFVVSAISQVIGSGTVILMAQAVGRKDHSDANLIFSQSIMLSGVLACLMLIIMRLVMDLYMRVITTDDDVVAAGVEFLCWAMPGYAVLLPTAVVGAALRSAGIVFPLVAVTISNVVLYATFATIFIGDPNIGAGLGVGGAGLAFTLSNVIGCMAIFLSMISQSFAKVKRVLLRPRLQQWKRILGVGIPTSSESVLVFSCTALSYYLIRDHGAPAQAGYAVGSILLQMMQLPGLSIAVALCSVVGQNLGSKNAQRVRDAFRKAVILVCSVAVSLMVFSHWQADQMVEIIVGSVASEVAAEFLKIMSLGLMAQGLVHICSATLQGLANTRPLIASTGAYFAAFVAGIACLSSESTTTPANVWWASLIAIVVQSGSSFWLLRRGLNMRLSVIGGL